MGEAFTPQDFIDDINRVSVFKDNRVFIWYCNLYTEHFVKLIFKKYKDSINYGHCSECNKSLEPSFMLKVKELSDAKLIDSETGHDKLIKLIYESRNAAGHELNFNEIKIIENIIKATSQTTKVDPYGLIDKLFQNISPWEKFKISAIAVVTSLYKNFEKMHDREISEKLIFELNPECTIILPRIIDKSDNRF